MQEEGDTVTTVIESQGDIEEVTQTTVTIEHKASGDVLDGDTGIVTSKYEGDADIDHCAADGGQNDRQIGVNRQPCRLQHRTNVARRRRERTVLRHEPSCPIVVCGWYLLPS